MGERGLLFELFLDRFVVPSGLPRDDKIESCPGVCPGTACTCLFHSGEWKSVFLFFILTPLGFDDFLCHVLRDHLIVVKFHGEVAATTGH